jgi:hypothetical protein
LIACSVAKQPRSRERPGLSAAGEGTGTVTENAHFIQNLRNSKHHRPCSQPFVLERLERSRVTTLTELSMPGRITHDSVQLDAPTSRAVAKGIGERLRQALSSDAPFPDRLQKLLDQMREHEARETTKNQSS